MNLQVLVLMPFKTGLFQNLMYLFTLFFLKAIGPLCFFCFFIKVDYFKFDLFAQIGIVVVIGLTLKLFFFCLTTPFYNL